MSNIEWLGSNRIRYYLGISSYGILFEEIYITMKNNKPTFTKIIYAHNKHNTKIELARTTYTLEEFSELITSINTMLSIYEKEYQSSKAKVISLISSIRGLLEALENEVNKNG
ncbi:MAG: hypothetical protein ACP5GU_04905 [Thermoprotei archaeon]